MQFGYSCRNSLNGFCETTEFILQLIFGSAQRKLCFNVKALFICVLDLNEDKNHLQRKMFRIRDLHIERAFKE